MKSSHPLMHGPSEVKATPDRFLYFPWLETNRTEAAELLRLSRRTGAADPVAWAARALSVSQQDGAGWSPLVVARAIALVEQDARSAVLAPAIERFSVAEVRQLAREMHRARATSGTTKPVAERWRTPQQALAAYNHPDWLDVRAGKLVPNASRLQGESLQAWRSLTDKFGTSLAKQLFDARVRAGTVTALINILDRAQSKHSLTVFDLTWLQYVAVTDGSFKYGVALPTLHDTFHTYGTSMREEMYGDGHTEGLARALFATDERKKISLQSGLPLTVQKDAVRQLNEYIEADFKFIQPENLLFDLRRTIYEDEPNDLGLPVYRHDWWSSPTQNALQMEKLFNGSGAVAHLDETNRRRLKAMISGANNPDSVAAISARFKRDGGHGTAALVQFSRELSAWLKQAFELVETGTRHRMISLAQYKEHAVHTVALALTLERAAPGALALGPSSTRTTPDALAAPLHSLDLRKAYPAVLREVRQALGLPP